MSQTYLDSLLDKHNLPKSDELIFDDGIPMEIERHRYQIELLISPLKIQFEDRNMFVGGNMFVYFSPNQVKTHDYRGPDFFIVLDVPKKERKGWVVWEEGKVPDVIIEIISDTTEKTDKKDKLDIYQNMLRVPEYYWYHPFTGELAGFRLKRGVYQEIAADKQDRLKSKELNLLLTRWQGSYEQINALWLRWMTTDGYLLPTHEDLKTRERIRADQAENQTKQAEKIAKQEQKKADRLAKKLKDLGIDIDD